MKTKRFIRNTLILIAPFLAMMLINEIHRVIKDDKGGIYNGLSTLNSSNAKVKKCTWYCHSNTPFCKLHHVSISKNALNQINPIYESIINTLKKGNDYNLMNVLFLVIIIPMFIWFFIIKALNIQDKINLIKNKRHGNYPNDL
jgi:hypothetical protein